MTVVDLYTIQIVDSNLPGAPLVDPERLAALMAETEENLTDLLPAGYRVRIRRWDHPEPEGENDE